MPSTGNGAAGFAASRIYEQISEPGICKDFAITLQQ
jgi:hypothetical protein